MAWRTEKPILLCAGSMAHSPVRAASPGSGRTAVAVADDPVGGAETSAGSVRSVRRNMVPRLNKFIHHLITARQLLPQAVLRCRRNIHVFATPFPENPRLIR